ncbi:MAG: STAS domain-containing protein [Candidatus Cloacimonadaceae bacterium]
MNVNFYEQGKVGVMEFQGRLDAYYAPELKQKFEQIITKTPYVVFDLRGCDFIDSTGLGMIVACLKSATQAGGDIRLVGLQEKPKMVFQITRAYKIFQFFDKVEAAIASYAAESDT